MCEKYLYINTNSKSGTRTPVATPPPHHSALKPTHCKVYGVLGVSWACPLAGVMVCDKLPTLRTPLGLETHANALILYEYQPKKNYWKPDNTEAMEKQCTRCGVESPPYHQPQHVYCYHRFTHPYSQSLNTRTRSAKCHQPRATCRINPLTPIN